MYDPKKELEDLRWLEQHFYKSDRSDIILSGVLLVVVAVFGIILGVAVFLNLRSQGYDIRLWQ